MDTNTLRKTVLSECSARYTVKNEFHPKKTVTLPATQATQGLGINTLR